MATFLLGYYTDTAGIAAAAIGTMFVICRLLDGVTDLIMGGLVDKTNTKLGKARPWLLLSAPLMTIGIILILNVPQGWDHTAKLIYAYITYIFLNCIVYTIFGISHAALLARMTRNFKDRNTMATVSSILNNAVGLAVGTIIRAVGIGPMFAGLYAFCADAADYGEWKFGVRSEGLMASSQSIGSKVGIGFGSACTAWILAAAGYVQPALDALPPLEGGEGPMGALPPMIEQPASVIAAIRFDYGWLGAIISVVLLIGVLMMDVEKYMPEIRRSLGDKKPVQM